MRITTVSQKHGLTSHEHHTSKGTGTRRSFLEAVPDPANGYVTFIGQGAMITWFLIPSVSMLVVKREATAKTPTYGG
jgi:hypothetical protein